MEAIFNLPICITQYPNSSPYFLFNNMVINWENIFISAFQKENRNKQFWELFEGDSQLIINAVQGIGEVVSSVQNIIQGVLRMVQSFRTFDFLHIKRQENVPVHLLVQHAQNVENLVVWLEECPSQVAHACVNDVTSLQRIE